MKHPIVVKDNALINASYNLDLVEQRLVLLAIIEARESKQKINAESELTIHVSSYINHFNVEKHTAYEMLKHACEALFHRQFSYKFVNQSKNSESVRSRWVSKISYVDNEALIRIVFAPDVIPLITRLEKHFTSYELTQVANLNSRYSLRLYELLIAWRSTGKPPMFQITELRKQLGVEETLYTRIEAFKRRVLNSAIAQINEHTDITVEYEQHKEGKTITGFSFSFKQDKVEKPIINKNIKSKTITKLSDNQIPLFANKLAYDTSFASQYSKAGESYDDFILRVKDDLKDPKKLKEYKPFLEKLGFK